MRQKPKKQERKKKRNEKRETKHKEERMKSQNDEGEPLIANCLQAEEEEADEQPTLQHYPATKPQKGAGKDDGKCQQGCDPAAGPIASQ